MENDKNKCKEITRDSYIYLYKMNTYNNTIKWMDEQMNHVNTNILTYTETITSVKINYNHTTNIKTMILYINSQHPYSKMIHDVCKKINTIQYAVCKQNGSQPYNNKITVKITQNVTERNKIRHTNVCEQNEQPKTVQSEEQKKQQDKRVVLGPPLKNDTYDKQTTQTHQQANSQTQIRQQENIGTNGQQNWQWNRKQGERQQYGKNGKGQQHKSKGKNKWGNTDTSTKGKGKRIGKYQTPYSSPIGKNDNQRKPGKRTIQSHTPTTNGTKNDKRQTNDQHNEQCPNAR